MNICVLIHIHMSIIMHRSTEKLDMYQKYILFDTKLLNLKKSLYISGKTYLSSFFYIVTSYILFN